MCFYCMHGISICLVWHVMRYLSRFCRFQFVGATFGPHELIRNLKHLSTSTVILILQKLFTCPSGKLTTESTSPIAKSTSPGLSDTTFFARCIRSWTWSDVKTWRKNIGLKDSLVVQYFLFLSRFPKRKVMLSIATLPREIWNEMAYHNSLPLGVTSDFNNLLPRLFSLNSSELGAGWVSAFISRFCQFSTGDKGTLWSKSAV